MINKKYLFILVHLFALVLAQNYENESYDDSDWVPIQPQAATATRAQGRVLNLDNPNQNFFPEEYRKRPIPQPQYFEDSPPPRRLVKPKHDQPYKFEPVLPLQPQQYQPQSQQQEKEQQFVPPPSPILHSQSQLNQHLTPPQASHNYYDTINQDKYQINQDLLNAHPQIRLNPISTNIPAESSTAQPKKQSDSVQLLYVPVESLNQAQKAPAPTAVDRKTESSTFIPSPQQPQKIFTQEELSGYLPQLQNTQRVHNVQNDFIQQAVAAHKLQQHFTQLETAPSVTSSSTTAPKPKIKKRKPHQPPLAVFMEKDGPAEVTDVLKMLKNAKSISVQDSVNPDSPQIFVGPSTLDTQSYAKFPLPYLSSIQGNRIERKVDELPFFVAPLSYKTPDGYSKIPLPAPHVGSVVVSNKQPPAIQNQIQQNFVPREQYSLNIPQRSYEIPSVPLESKNYLPQIDTFNPYLPNNEQVSSKPQNVYSNHYDIDQINQFIEASTRNPTQVRSTTQQVYTTQDYNNYEHSTPARVRSRGKPRGRGSSTTTTTTTTSTTPNNQYEHVLEQFTINPNTRPIERVPNSQRTSPQRYQTEVETIPATVYKLETVETPKQTLSTTQKNYDFNPIQQDFTPLIYNNRAKTHQKEQVSQKENAQEVFTTKQNIQEVTTLAALRNFPSVSDFYIDKQQNTGRYTPQDQFSSQVYQNPYNIETQPQQISLVPQSQFDFTNKQQNQNFYQQDIQTNPLSQTEEYNQHPDYRAAPVSNLSSAEEAEYDQYLPGLINNLQDQAVRPLLVPNLLVPTTESIPVSYTTTTTTTTPRPTTTTTTTQAPKIETTTPRKTRGRQRGTISSRQSTTQSTRRRRPSSAVRTTTTEATVSYEPTKTSNVQKQRFRTRGRPAQTVTENVLQTTEYSFKQPPLQSGFKASNGEPQSYMQFDHVIDNQQVITLKPEQEEKSFRDYHQVYNLPEKTEISDSAHPPLLDVQIAHPQEPQIIRKEEDTQFVRISSNLQYADPPTTKPPTRRSRIRTKTRVSSTHRPSTTHATTTTPKPQIVEEEEDEDYGFIRTPNYNKPSLTIKTTTPQFAFIDLNEEDGEAAPSTPVQFIGEIRPKYTTTETPKFKPRAKVRIINQSAYNEVKSQPLDDQVTRRSSTVVRGRTRGKSHYKPPPSEHKKEEDTDVEGGNYPIGFIAKRTTTKPIFQITIDPLDEEIDDQVPHSSIFIPNIVKKPDWVEASPLPNQLEFEGKPLYSATPNDLEDTELTTTEQPDKAKRRGVWKLVRHTPVDSFEEAESQNYYTVLNKFDDILKEKPTKIVEDKINDTAATTENTILNTLYNMFNFDEEVPKDTDEAVMEEKENTTTTTTISPTFPQEITEQSVGETTVPPETTTLDFDVEPWKMRNVKTSTSTEVSHETEICFKGRCVKSNDKQKLRLE